MCIYTYTQYIASQGTDLTSQRCGVIIRILPYLSVNRLLACNATYMQYMNHQIEVIEVLKPDGDFGFIVV